jgi:hypothetical protein
MVTSTPEGSRNGKKKVAQKSLTAVTNSDKTTAKHDKAIAMLAAIREPSDENHNNGRHNVDGDAVNLRFASLPAELDEDCRHEEDDSVPRDSRAQKYQGRKPDLPVTKDELICLFVQRIHCDVHLS